MTGRERVLAAMRREPPDRTPIFEKLIKSPHTDALLGRPCAATNFEYRMERLADGAWEELHGQAARDLVDTAEALQFDMVPVELVGGPPAERPVRLAPGRWRTGEVEHELTSSGWVVERRAGEERRLPLEEQESRTLADLDAGWEAPRYGEEATRLIREVRAELRRRGLDLALFGMAYGLGVNAQPAFVLRWFGEQHPALDLFYRRAKDHSLAAALAQVRAGVHVVSLGGDIAMDQGPIISPGCYRRYLLPLMQESVTQVHEAGGLCTNASDGNLGPLLDDFLAGAGVDGFDEIDYGAGVRLDWLRERYDICCLGNLDIRHVLTHGTPQQAREHTLEVLRAGGGEAGGHILMSSNCLHEDVKLDLYLEAVATYRSYFGLEPLDLHPHEFLA